MTTPKKPDVMTRPIELWQAILATIGLICTIGYGYVNKSNELTKAEVEIEHLKEFHTEDRARFDKIDVHLDGMSDQNTRILIKLEDKKNINR